MSYCKYRRSRHSSLCVDLPDAPTIPRVLTSAPSPTTGCRTHVSASGITNPGAPRRMNQDAFFVHSDRENRAMVLGVFDGHGRETGREASTTAKSFFEAQFRSYRAADYAQLEDDPHTTMTQLFRTCHEMIKSVFRNLYEQRGYIVREDLTTGTLTRHETQHPSSEGTCIRGGTTATIVVILDGGRKIVSANVGDSAALLGAPNPMLTDGDVKPCASLSSLSDVSLRQSSPTMPFGFDDAIEHHCVHLTGDHGADNEREFVRVAERRKRCQSESQVDFLFESPMRGTLQHYSRSPVFKMSPKGVLMRNMRGDFIKNVRDEWATVVATPEDAPHQDSLAFTRTLGDFHMHSYGVSCEPTVQEMSLEDVVSRRARKSNNNNASPESTEPTSDAEFLLVVASDGIWDNWKFGELFDFLHSNVSARQRVPTLGLGLTTSSSASSSGKSITKPRVDQMAAALMDTNLLRAAAVFGDQVDNMTAIVCRIAMTSAN